MEGWKNNNLHALLSCIHEDCVIIESHGPTYHGAKDLKKWFELWMDAESHILRWKIESFIFAKKEQTAFCQWDFACISNSTEYAFLGMSIYKFNHNKISFIHEYRMSQPPYRWMGNTLNSD
jgi:hypothetical protein